jgi:hypothetical protein
MLLSFHYQLFRTKKLKSYQIMKKIVFTVLAIEALAFTSCSGDDDSSPNCQTLATNLQTATENYFEDDSAENCQALASAVEAFQNSDCEGSDIIQAPSCE